MNDAERQRQAFLDRRESAVEFQKLLKEAHLFDLESFKSIIANHDAVCLDIDRMHLLADATTFKDEANVHVSNVVDRL